MTIAHILFLVLPTCPDGSCNGYIMILPFLLLGVFYSCYSAVLWPCVALVCDNEILGTAFGLITSVQNGGMALGPVIIGSIIKNTTYIKDGYFWMSWFFIIIGVICVVIQIILWYYDVNHRDIFKIPSQ